MRAAARRAHWRGWRGAAWQLACAPLRSGRCSTPRSPAAPLSHPLLQPPLQPLPLPVVVLVVVRLLLPVLVVLGVGAGGRWRGSCSPGRTGGSARCWGLLRTLGGCGTWLGQCSRCSSSSNRPTSKRCSRVCTKRSSNSREIISRHSSNSSSRNGHWHPVKGSCWPAARSCLSWRTAPLSPASCWVQATLSSPRPLQLSKRPFGASHRCRRPLQGLQHSPGFKGQQGMVWEEVATWGWAGMASLGWRIGGEVGEQRQGAGRMSWRGQ